MGRFYQDMSMSTSTQLESFKNTNVDLLKTSGDVINTTLNQMKTITETVEGNVECSL